LPIYHSNGGLIGIGAALISGATVVLRKKFSATTFWDECRTYKCTVFSYVGEVCRYLMNQPESTSDKNHPVRICIGNGLRRNIHERFSKRFNIKCCEIYGATEGNCTLGNFYNLII
jgi:acyl-CoA synthetase (AMP-forming)/AMP-acid ligase II